MVPSNDALSLRTLTEPVGQSVVPSRFPDPDPLPHAGEDAETRGEAGGAGGGIASPITLTMPDLPSKLGDHGP
jgi:hypothetical protein